MLRSVGKALFAALIYYLLARFGMAVFALKPGNITLLWLPSGVALLMNLAWGIRVFPLVVAASFAANFPGLNSGPVIKIWPVVGVALADGGAGLLAAKLLRRYLPQGLLTVNELLPFGFWICLVTTALTSVVLTSTLWAGGYLIPEELPAFFLQLTLADSLGILLVYPLYQGWREHRALHASEWRWLLSSAVALIAILLLSLQWVPSAVYAVLPLLLLLSFNAELFVVIALSALAMIAVIAATARGLGPFAAFSPADANSSLMVFVFSSALTILGMALQNRQLARSEDSRRLLGEASQAKSRFLARMTHEIRTPMNGILGIARLFQWSRLEKEQAHQVKIILDSGQMLLKLLNDVLDFSKIEAAQMKIETAAFSLKDLVRETHQLMATSDKKDLRMKLSLDARIPELVTGDNLRLRQVLTNLLSNAAKFTHTGEIHLEVKETQRSTDSVTVYFAVHDTGIGMVPEVLSRIFGAYVQADESTSRKYGGTGLGLPIASELLLLMGGILKVDSTPDKGSIFFFSLTFPVIATGGAVLRQAVSPDAQPISVPDMTLAKKNPLRILVAEDNEINQIVTEASLAAFGYTADFAQNGVEAVAKAREQKYDLIFMDIFMPELDGYDAVKAIRADKTIQQPRIIALTANAQADIGEHVASSGMDGMLIKPFELSELRAILISVNSSK
jgi:signal transduction histidine kinase/ActR/RegA family two-component response regulator